MEQKKLESYAKYQNYTNRTLYRLLESGELDDMESLVVKMIIDGRKK